jgi:hypothetical protein
MRPTLNKKVVCADGFTLSVQANENAYCSPRINDATLYVEVEVGFPSGKEELIMPWAEDPEEPTETVYGYVPVSVVTNVLAKHGGIVGGQVPPGVAHLESVYAPPAIPEG